MFSAAIFRRFTQKLPCLFLCVCFHSALAEAPDEATAWIQQLGDDSFKVRENAEKELRAMGTEAVPQLEPLKDAADPEIRMRVLRLLESVGSDFAIFLAKAGVCTGHASEGETVWPCILRVTSYDPDTKQFAGRITWLSLNAEHAIEGQLTDKGLEFRETKYIRRGNAVLNVQYNFPLKSDDGGKRVGTWMSADTQRSGEVVLQLTTTPEAVPLEVPGNL